MPVPPTQGAGRRTRRTIQVSSDSSQVAFAVSRLRQAAPALSAGPRVRRCSQAVRHRKEGLKHGRDLLRRVPVLYVGPVLRARRSLSAKAGIFRGRAEREDRVVMDQSSENVFGSWCLWPPPAVVPLRPFHACVSPRDAMAFSSWIKRSARIRRCSASSGANPRSRRTLPPFFLSFRLVGHLSVTQQREHDDGAAREKEGGAGECYSTPSSSG
jgi:hypothetical protein